MVWVHADGVGEFEWWEGGDVWYDEVGDVWEEELVGAEDLLGFVNTLLLLIWGKRGEYIRLVGAHRTGHHAFRRLLVDPEPSRNPRCP